ncbi:MAG TPA: heme exporter protein CcmB, partial [Steroidobacteraceae bacterium]|nr:heme exporter protein CcmB [Steroidobacteraceae bacterium]
MSSSDAIRQDSEPRLGREAFAIHAQGGGPGAVPALAAARLVLARDLKLAFRKRSQLVQPLAFFAIVTTLFPLGISPELPLLRPIAAGVVYVAILLAGLLTLPAYFERNAAAGVTEQHALLPLGLEWVMLAQGAAHWLTRGVPLALAGTLAAMLLFYPVANLPWLALNLLLGTGAISFLGLFIAALVAG